MVLEQTRVEHLTTAAAQAAERAYAPYSGFAVGAALLFDDGAVVSGCNVENASYGLTCCAERNALFRAISEQGARRHVVAFAVFHDGPEACVPCGACLQVLSEFVAPGCAVMYSRGAEFVHAAFEALLPVRFDRSAP